MSHTSVSASVSKNVAIHFRCEHCKQHNLITSRLTKHGSSRRNGLEFRSSVRGAMRDEATQESRDNLYSAECDLEAGIENAIRQDLEVKAECSHCHAIQSWARTISKTQRIDGFLTLGVFLLIILPFLIWIGVIKLETARALPLLLGLLPVVFITRISLPRIVRNQLTKHFSQMPEGMRPRVFTDQSRLTKYLLTLGRKDQIAGEDHSSQQSPPK